MEQLSTEPMVAAPQGQARIQHRVIKMPQADSGRILIVEDEIELTEVLEYNLIRQGFEVLSAENGLDACRLIGQEKPELILLDIMLPLLDGWEICRMVRSHHDPSVARTPIIMMSALGSADDRVKGYDLGADHYLPKPYIIKEVMVKCRQLIDRHRDYCKLTARMDSLQKWTDLQDRWQQALFHELRNQLTVISGIALHLQENTDLPPERSEQFVGQISSSSHYLSALAENYLLVRQVEKNPGQLPGEPVILQELLEELRSLFASAAAQKSSRLEIFCAQRFTLNLHPVGLKIILSSLLDNAIKYSRLDGHLSVSVSVAVDETEVQILIQDDGPGIAAEERDMIFAKFYRGATAQQKPAGSGLGLYMARTLSEAMGGKLQLVENQSPGCCFQLSFPCRN